MAVTNKIRCHKCGHEFERTYGVGILGKGSLYCDKCGRAANIDFSLGWGLDMECECGGMFKAENLGCCERCGVKLEEGDVMNG